MNLQNTVILCQANYIKSRHLNLWEVIRSAEPQALHGCVQLKAKHSNIESVLNNLSKSSVLTCMRRSI